jgi:hypothetical protein
MRNRSTESIREDSKMGVAPVVYAMFSSIQPDCTALVVVVGNASVT